MIDEYFTKIYMDILTKYVKMLGVNEPSRDMMELETQAAREGKSKFTRAEAFAIVCHQVYTHEHSRNVYFMEDDEFNDMMYNIIGKIRVLIGLPLDCGMYPYCIK